MVEALLTQIRGWLNSKFVPGYAPYWRAKRLHEHSPHGLFPLIFFHALSSNEVESALACPRLSEAIGLYKECIEREKEAGRFFNQGIALHQLGMVFHRQGRLAEAREAFEQALDLLSDSPQSEALSAVSGLHFRLAEIHFHNGDLTSARKHLLTGRSIDQSLGDDAGVKWSEELQKKFESARGNQMQPVS